jgi:hypothetical protein
MDAKGKKRIVMQVTAQGVPTLTFLDENGHSVRELSAESR